MLKKALQTLQPIVKIPTRQFSLARISKYPFGFDGISDSEFDYYKYGKINNFTNEILGGDSQPGFKLAFATYCDALIDNDIDFLRENCEPKFAKETEESLNSIKEDGLQIVGHGIDTNNINVLYAKVGIYLGVNANRLLNKPASSYQIQEMPFFELVNFKVFLQKDLSMFQTNLNMLPFVEVDVVYQAPLRLSLVEKSGKTVAGERPTNTHVVRFASFRDPNAVAKGTTSMLEIASKFRTFMNPAAQDKAKIFQEILLGESYSWKIVDVDRVMRGNPPVADH